MPAEEFWQYGHQLIDWIADFPANVGNLQAFPIVQLAHKAVGAVCNQACRARVENQ
jgi:hypothetical protein